MAFSYFYKQSTVVLLLISLVFVPTGQALAANVPIASLPKATLVAEPAEQLNSAGCQVVVPVGDGANVTVPGGMPYHVVSQQETDVSFMCSVESVKNLTPIEGEVAGIQQFIGQDAEAIIPALLAPLAVPVAISAIVGAGAWLFTKLFKGVATGLVTTTVSGIVIWLATMVGALGILLIQIGSTTFGFILAQGGFITNDAVRVGWPLVQGVANIGFVLVLLFIAFATTLRIEIGGLRKVLPRLLIAAILINFSLVIGGVIIDSSRILMAITTNIMIGSTDPGAIGVKLLSTSNIITANFSTGHGGLWTLLANFGSNSASAVGTSVAGFLSNDYGLAAGVALGAALIWVYVLTLWFLIILLLFRYAMLILLLIISPIAYLAAVLPNTKQFATKWWSNFLKWTFFAPVALFIMALAIRLEKGINIVPKEAFNNKGALFNTIMHVVVIGVFFYVAATSGKYIGGAASSMAMGWAKSGTDKAKAYGKSFATSKYQPYNMAGTAISRRARSFGSEVTRPFRKSMGLGEYSKYDAKTGQLKSGKKDIGSMTGKAVAPVIRTATGAAAGALIGSALGPAGTVLGGLAGGGLGMKSDARDILKKQNQLNAAKAIAKNTGGYLTNPNEVNTNAIFSARNLKDADVKMAMGKNVVHSILMNANSTSQVQAIVNDKEYMGSMEDDDKFQMITSIQQNVNLSAQQAIPTIAKLTAQGLTPQEASQARAQIAAESSQSNNEAKAKIVNQLMESIYKPTSN